MNTLNTLLLMAPPAEGQEGSSLPTLIMFGGILLVMYFFMIRPQAKKAKEAAKFRDALSKGDRIVTAGGIHGKIAEVKDTTVIIDVEGGTKLKVEKSSISTEAGGRLDENKK